MSTIYLSWKNLWNKPLSTALSVLLFALGVGLISLLLILGRQLQEKFDKNLAEIDLVVGAKGSPLQLILCSMYHIDVPTGNISVKEAKPFLNPDHPIIKKAIPLSLGDSYKGHRIVGTIPDFLELYQANIDKGKVWSRNFEVTIGAAIADELLLKIGDQFNSSHGFSMEDDFSHDHASFKVVGILKPTGTVVDQLILSNTESIWEVHDHNPLLEIEQQEGYETEHEGHSHEGHDHDKDPMAFLEHEEGEITSLLIQYKTRNFQTLNLPRNINENTDLQAASPAIEINRLYSMVGVGLDALKIIAYIIVFVSALSIFISLFNSLKERKYELSLMRVMGAGRTKLFTLIVLEGILMAVLGYVIGILLSHGAMEVLSGFMKSSYRYTFSGKVFLTAEWYLLAGALIVGFVSALIPAYEAAKTDISRILSKS